MKKIDESILKKWYETVMFQPNCGMPEFNKLTIQDKIYFSKTLCFVRFELSTKLDNLFLEIEIDLRLKLDKFLIKLEKLLTKK